jgi:hypothetical protein
MLSLLFTIDVIHTRFIKNRNNFGQNFLDHAENRKRCKSLCQSHGIK